MVPMNESTVASVRHLLNMILSEVDLLFPDVDERFLEVVTVQFIATLIELDEKSGVDTPVRVTRLLPSTQILDEKSKD